MITRAGRAELESRLESAHRRIAQLEGALEKRSGRDQLTGLLDLRLFRARLDAEVQRMRRHGRSLTVALLDLDGFEEINVNHGPGVGDAVLRAVGAVLSSSTRVHDVVSRSGPDEFAVMLPETDELGASQLFERVLLELEALETSTVHSVSASVGIAAFSGHANAELLLATAGRALDRARGAGGGRVATVSADEATMPAEELVRRDAVTGLAVTLLERDRYTGEHSESVVEMAGRVARELVRDHEEVERVRTAALLHDIGKVAIPDHILHKAGPLDDAEWALMREHPVIGERILRAIPGLGGVARIVRHEHERFDGGGYPDGLAGTEIPLGSRIILACDTYHAMTSDRPYREAMSHADALAELGRCAGTQFDPEVVEVLIGYLYGQRQAVRPAGPVAA